MVKANFHLAKFLNTIGFKKNAKIIWDRAEKESKQERFGVSNFQSIFLNDGTLTNHLSPKKEIIESLAQEQVYGRAKNFFDVFGFTTLRGYLKKEKVKNIDDILNTMRDNSAPNKSIYASPVEKNQEFQEILIKGSIFESISKVIGPFWYFSSDAAVRSAAFPLHRDTFFDPPLYKIFVPTKPGIFQVLCGSHYPTDEFSKNVGSFICNWDKPNNLSHGSSSVYFQNNDLDVKIIGYDDSHNNPPLTNIPLNAGDVFIFNQNLVHGLLPVDTSVSFIAMSVFPSPENAKKFNMTRQEHLEKIIRSTASITLVEKDLSGSKNLELNEIVYPARAFKEKDLSNFASDKRLRDYFGLSRIPISTWDSAINSNSHAHWEVLRDNL